MASASGIAIRSSRGNHRWALLTFLASNTALFARTSSSLPRQTDGTVVADIVDPHGLHLADALPKLQGLALYAETHAKAYRRIESVAEAMGKLRVLDLIRRGRSERNRDGK